ncbi:MAG: ATPase domain-containing protein [Haloarculaceae archaeon]|jgi:KaiC/GvpD/RAD55 family RecA-like ATPase
MEYSLAIENAPETVPGGTSILLVHPSTAETDRVDTDFLKTDTDHLLVVSTRTTAREVKQKLEHYEVDEKRATILDTLSVERGYSRRKSDSVRYVSSPDDLDGIVDQVQRFLTETDGKRRVSVDSITEMIYYADEEQAREAVQDIQSLLADHDAVGLFHLAAEVHEEPVVDDFRSLFDGIVELDEDGTLTATF